MAKVLICSDSPFLNTGFANVARFIGKTLHSGGHEVFHLGFSDPRMDKLSSKWGGRVLPWSVFSTTGQPEDRFGQRSYNGILSQVEPNLIIIVADVWNVDHLLSLATCPTVLLLHIEGAPLPTKIVQERPRELIIPQIISHANLVISAGPFGRKTIQQRMIEYCKIPPAKSEKEVASVMNNTNIIIPDAVDTSVFKPIERAGLKGKMFKGIKDTDFVIGYFGRQNPRKGLPYAIKAFAEWKDRPENAFLYLHTAIRDRAGWNLPQLLVDSKIQEKVIIDPSIKVGGGCSDEVLNALYNACFVGGTPVLTLNGYRPIESIMQDDMVISAQGNLRKVVAVSKREYKGAMVNILSTRNQIGPICTSNHKFLALDPATRKPTYKEVGTLSPGDMLLSPVPAGPGLIMRSSTQDLCEALDIQDTYVKKRYDTVVEPLRDGYNVKRRDGSVPHIFCDGKEHIVSVVEKVLQTDSSGVIVYNIEVEEDHSYVACGYGVKNCDITLLPSTGEGAGLTVCESSAAGIPAVTTDYAETPNYIGDVCELVKPDAYWIEPITNIHRAVPSIDGIISKVKKLHRETKYRLDLGQRARAEIVKNFDIKVVAPMWLDIVKTMAKKSISKVTVEERKAKRKGRRVCFIGTYFVPDLIGGGEITYYKLLMEFQKRGWDASAFICRDGIRDEDIDIDGIHVSRRDKGGMDRKITAYLEEMVPDVVITTLIDPIFTRMALHAAKNVGATVVYYEQFYNSICTRYRDVMSLGPENAAPWGNEILSMCDLIYSNGEFVRQAMQKHQGFESKILHPYINLEEAKVEKWEPEYVTMINPDPGKGGETLLYMAKKMPDVKFLTIKVSDKNDYRILPEKDGEIPNLAIWDFQKDIRKIYERTKVLLVPTIVDETFCRVIPEAQSNGIPIIGRNVGGIMNTMGEGGILIGKFEDDDVWCSTLRKLLDDRDQYKTLSEKAVENSKKINYDIEFSNFFSDIDRAMSPLAKEKKICCVVPDFAGVSEVFGNMKALHPNDVELIGVNATTRPSNIVSKIEQVKPKTLVFGAWIPMYKDIMMAVRKKDPTVRIAVGWFSNFSQMEFSSNNELGIFTDIKQWTKMENPLVNEIWMSSVEDGRLMGKVNPAIKVLACPINLPNRTPFHIPEIGKIKVSLFCTPGSRKNLSNQIVACSLIPNVELHLNGLSKRPEFSSLLTTLKVRYIDHGWMDKATYKKVVESMDIGLQVTFAETFNYVVAEHMMAGVPIVTSFMVPITNNEEPLYPIMVKKADSPSEIAEKMQEAHRNRSKYSALSLDAIRCLAEKNNAELKGLLGI
jgi:glycosyltransferase involved in cell wall biosynthesis